MGLCFILTIDDDDGDDDDALNQQQTMKINPKKTTNKFFKRTSNK